MPRDFSSSDSPASAAPVLPVLCAGTLVAAALLNPLDVSGSGLQQVGLSGQVALKLIVAALAIALGLWSAVCLPSVRRALSSLPAVALLALAGVFAVTSLVAIEEVANVSRVAAVILLGYILLVTASVVLLGIDRVAISILIGCTLFLVGSWAAYLAVPAVGVYVEDLGEGGLVERMGGLCHPNVLGRVAVLTVLLSLVIYQRSPRYRLLLAATLLVALATAAMAFSRTAWLAGAVAVTLMFADLLRTRRVVLLGLGVSSLVIAGILITELATDSGGVSRVLLSAATKSGNVEELTSATGRTAIWSESMRLIALRPMTGYGLNSGPVLLTRFSQHTHNIILHPLLSGGLLAGTLVSGLLVFNLLVAMGTAHRLLRGVAFFVLVSGLFEDTILGTFPGPTTMLWLAITVYPGLVPLLECDDSSVEDSASLRYTVSDCPLSASTK